MERERAPAGGVSADPALQALEGPRLADLIRHEGALNPAWVLTIMESLANSLHVHHGSGIVFGNVNTKNIVVRETDGAARFLDPAPGKESTAANDVRDLHAVMYEALCGVPPKNPPRPVAEHQPDLDSDLDRVFAEQSGSARALLDAIRQLRGVPAEIFVDELPPAASKAAPAPATADVAPRSKARYALVLLLLIPLVLFLIFRGGDPAPVTRTEVPAPATTFTVSDPKPEIVAVEPDGPPVDPEPVPVEAAPAPAPKKTTTPKETTPPVRKTAAAPVEPKPVEAEPVVVALTEEPAAAAAIEPEPSPPAAATPTTATLEVVIRNGVRDGRLELSADGVEIFRTQLTVDEKRWRHLAQKAVGRGRGESSDSIEIPAETHRIVARMVDSKGRDFEESVTLEVEPGETATLRIVTGKTIGKRLKLEVVR